jgi:hypothetical protein
MSRPPWPWSSRRAACRWRNTATARHQSKAGGADTLEALGVNLTIAPEVAEAQLNDLGICFLFAQNHHPGMKRIAPFARLWASAQSSICSARSPTRRA